MSSLRYGFVLVNEDYDFSTSEHKHWSTLVIQVFTSGEGLKTEQRFYREWVNLPFKSGHSSLHQSLRHHSRLQSHLTRNNFCYCWRTPPPQHLQSYNFILHSNNTIRHVSIVPSLWLTQPTLENVPHSSRLSVSPFHSIGDHYFWRFVCQKF